MKAHNFKASDGKKYNFGEWNLLPFIKENKQMVPTMKYRLFLKTPANIECRWIPFYLPEEAKRLRVSEATHWMAVKT